MEKVKKMKSKSTTIIIRRINMEKIERKSDKRSGRMEKGWSERKNRGCILYNCKLFWN